MALLAPGLCHHHLTSLGHYLPSPLPARPPPPSPYWARPPSCHLFSLALRNHQRPPALPPFHQLTALSLCHHQLTAARPPTPSTSPTLPRMQPTSPARPPSHQLSLNASNFPLPPLASPPSTPPLVLSTTNAPRLATINFPCRSRVTRKYLISCVKTGNKIGNTIMHLPFQFVSCPPLTF